MAKTMDTQTKDKYIKRIIIGAAAAVIVIVLFLAILAIPSPPVEVIKIERPISSVTERLICDAVDFGDGTIKAACENERGELSGWVMTPFKLGAVDSPTTE